MSQSSPVVPLGPGGMDRARLGLIAVVAGCLGAALVLPQAPRCRAALGLVAFLGLAAACSRQFRAIQWRPIVGGL
ncbi:MAG: hypothetical protein NZ703_14445, partial [Gemmataceae bacterium]|nr:hypothetical protein [Gemmataceae bacterium]